MDRTSDRNKRIYAVVGIIALILLLPFSAYAFEYREDGMAIDIPDGSNIYYYTATGTNMTGEMLDAAQEEAPVVLTGAYSEDGVLSYSLKITREEAEPTQENGTGAAQGKAAAVKEGLAEEYAFSEDTEETVAGRQSVVLSGDSLKNPDYAARLYILEDSGSIYTATVIYRKSADGQYLNAAMAQLGTWKLGADAVPTSVPTPTPEPTLEAAPTAAVTPETAPLSMSSMVPLERPESAQAGIEISSLFKNPMALVLGAALVVIVILVFLLVSKNKKTKHSHLADGGDAEYDGRLGRSEKSLPMEEKKETVQWKQEDRKVEIHPEQQLLEPDRQEHEYAPEMEQMIYPQPLIPQWTAADTMHQETYGDAQKAVSEIYNAETELMRGFDLKSRKDYIFAAKQFHECVKHTEDKMIQKTADLQTVECLTLAKQYDAALVLAIKVFYKEYEYSVEEREKLKSMIIILKKTSRRK